MDIDGHQLKRTLDAARAAREHFRERGDQWRDDVLGDVVDALKKSATLLTAGYSTKAYTMAESAADHLSLARVGPA